MVNKNVLQWWLVYSKHACFISPVIRLQSWATMSFRVLFSIITSQAIYGSHNILLLFAMGNHCEAVASKYVTKT